MPAPDVLADAALQSSGRLPVHGATSTLRTAPASHNGPRRSRSWSGCSRKAARSRRDQSGEDGGGRPSAAAVAHAATWSRERQQCRRCRLRTGCDALGEVVAEMSSVRCRNGGAVREAVEVEADARPPGDPLIFHNASDDPPKLGLATEGARHGCRASGKGRPADTRTLGDGGDDSSPGMVWRSRGGTAGASAVIEVRALRQLRIRIPPILAPDASLASLGAAARDEGGYGEWVWVRQELGIASARKNGCQCSRRGGWPFCGMSPYSTCRKQRLPTDTYAGRPWRVDSVAPSSGETFFKDLPPQDSLQCGFVMRCFGGNLKVTSPGRSPPLRPSLTNFTQTLRPLHRKLGPPTARFVRETVVSADVSALPKKHLSVSCLATDAVCHVSASYFSPLLCFARPRRAELALGVSRGASAAPCGSPAGRTCRRGPQGGGRGVVLPQGRRPERAAVLGTRHLRVCDLGRQRHGQPALGDGHRRRAGTVGVSVRLWLVGD
eukprot:ctg_313.g176